MITDSDKPFNTKFTSEILCPYCCTKQHVDLDYQEESGELECQSCWAYFSYEFIVTVEFTTEKLT